MLKAYAQGEMVIIDFKARKKGDEIIRNGLVVGVEQHGEIPIYGTVVSLGPDVPREVIDIGAKVLLPDTSRSQHVYDPRIVEGTMTSDDKDRATMITTHYKNICVVYKNDA